MLKVLSPGLQTTIQDLGRYGWYHIGMPPAGAMDQFSLRVGNMLVGNDENAAGLEMTFIGPELEVVEPCTLVVTGGQIELRLNGAPVPAWTAIETSTGDRLSCGTVVRGVRAYLCVAGGIDTPPVLGSRSTYLLGRFGGKEGRALAAGDILPVGRPMRPGSEMIDRRLDARLLPAFPTVVRLRIIMGLCSYRLTDESVADFLGSTWKVSTEADRIGYRLEGPYFKFTEREQPFGAGSDPSNVVDLGYPVGSIQVPGGMEAILLMRDAVTGGGYATIGAVVQCDLDQVAQAGPGSRLEFEPIDIREALRLRRAHARRIAKVAEDLALFDRCGWLGQ